MGMYTELIFGASLRTDTPQGVIDTLRYMIGDIEEPETVLFNEGRNPLGGGSTYFGVCDPVCRMWFDDIKKEWIISTRSNVKNYDNEIEKFLAWIKPYIQNGSGERKMYAIVTYEQSVESTIYYLYDLVYE